ncbi:MAG: hypothetical protein RLZZ319_813 [Actinomycetota bacterium]
MSDADQPAEGKPEYQRIGAPGPGSPEYEAMDQLAKMFERQVDELRGEGHANESTS